MLIARLPHRLREYRYHDCYDDLTGQPLGFLVSLQVVPCWIKGSWNLTVTGMNWGDETSVEYKQDQIHLLRITGEQVSISELAWCLYRAEQMVDLVRPFLGHDPNFELAAERTLEKVRRLVVKTVMANDLNYRSCLELLEAECFLLSCAPTVEIKT